MKVPVSWLKEYVEFDDTLEGLTDKLTFSGTEVEGIHTVGSDYEGIVVGEVEEVGKHPDADRLSVCRVNDGTETHEVVCGAPNVVAGGKYPFAPVGTTLPNGMKLKKAKIRGVTSFGMLCAEDELGLSDDHTGLLELKPDAEPGTPLSDILGPPEIVLELEVTPNRPDCLSMLGIAREVAAMYGTELKRPKVDLTETAEKAEKLTRVEILDAERCPRYTARVLHEVEIAPSPDWMQKRLTLAGIRPINNIVDITNYVLLECGHPLHAFDQDLLDEGRIVVRRAEKGEKMETLDEVERTLSEDMLVIADASRPVAVAGVMGGAGSEIRDNTSNVLLESAYFEPDNIRLTSKALGLSTESSYRFERGTDIGGVEWASRRAAALMAEYAGGKVAEGIVDVYPAPAEQPEITCRVEQTARLLGVELDAARMEEIFTRLELPVTKKTGDACTIRVPTFRTDLEREVDLIEEFARIHGLDRVPSPLPQSKIIPDADDSHMRAVMICRRRLAGLGLRETMNYSLLSEPMLELFGLDDPQRRIRLPHPISQDQSVLRTTLIPQLAESLGHNHARQVREAAFFELGRIFLQGKGEATEEEERIAIGLCGPVGRGTLGKRDPIQPDEMFLWLKGILESFMVLQGIDNWGLESGDQPAFEEGQAAVVTLAGKPIGVMGNLKKAIRDEWRMNDPVAVAELSLPPLLAHTFDTPVLEEVAPYPPVERDIAMIVDKGLKNEDIVAEIERAAPEELEEVELFDIFESDTLGEDKRSLAYALTYRSLKRTLTDEEVNEYHEAVKGALKKALQVEIRES